MFEIPKAYEKIQQATLSDLHSEGYVLKHVKSGARVVLMENDDENKVFYIGFKTPVSNSCGCPHIVEHSVLCGSDKYPIKDPFVELVKGSMNTFLNAMTYPDKTVYPVASTNDKDFANLMDVYMDAVLHPNIYRHEEIFKQEGWHYELSDADDELTINGVVYNEMKGAFSSPDDVLSREILNSLFPDTTYAFESGGDPDVIPELSYEEFLDFHRRFYHPVNSYIFLYGDMDMTERLNFLDEAYLSKYDAFELDSHIDYQKAFEKPVEVNKFFPISSEEKEEDQTYLSINYCIGDILDPMLYQAFDILDYALLSMPGAPLKQALFDAGIGKDLLGGYDSGTLQPMFSVIAKGANMEQKDEFLSIIKSVLKEQADGALDKNALYAAINSAQFRLREADFGSYPKGLMYGLQTLDSWLYDDARPFIHSDGIRVLDELSKKVENGYFEGLIKKYLIDNPHVSIVTVEPKKGLTKEKEEALRKKLAAYKASLSAEEIGKIVAETAHLKEYQATPSTEEELLTLPLLERKDLRRTVRPMKNEITQKDGITVLHHAYETNGIHYLNLSFDTKDVPLSLAPALSLYSRILGYVDTGHFTYSGFANEVNLHTGGISPSLKIYSKDDGSYRFMFEVHAKYLYGEMDRALSLTKEMMFSSKYSDRNRLHELLSQETSGMQMRLLSAGHALSANRAAAYFSDSMKVTDAIAGIAYYEYIKDFEEHFDEKADAFIALCDQFEKALFVKENLTVSSTGTDEAKEQTMTILSDLEKNLYEGGSGFAGAADALTLSGHNEGIETAAQVQYVSRAGSFKEAGFDYTGAMKTLKVILNYDYFWLNIRVKGGAYGCMSSFTRNGGLSFSSYRDPNLSETNDIFEGTAEYLRGFAPSERDMTKYVIGTISGMDTPLTPSQLGVRSFTGYMTDMTEERLQKERDEVLNVTAEDIRALAGPGAAAMRAGHICVIGNETKIGGEKALFESVRTL
ncbi:MAG: insulinase family protein [Lachnospiraceae bacterium]|nr:insulinase family protein [Lachnospiraceae bacterium]